MADKDFENTILESLKLIIQSQMVLSDLQHNQSRLEALLDNLESEVES